MESAAPFWESAYGRPRTLIVWKLLKLSQGSFIQCTSISCTSELTGPVQTSCVQVTRWGKTKLNYRGRGTCLQYPPCSSKHELHHIKALLSSKVAQLSCMEAVQTVKVVTINSTEFNTCMAIYGFVALWRLWGKNSDHQHFTFRRLYRFYESWILSCHFVA